MKKKKKQNKNSSYSRISSNGYLATKATFLFWRAKSRGDWGEASPNKEARRGTMGREKEGNKPFLTFHSPNRPPDFLGIPRRGGGLEWLCVGEIETSWPTRPRLLAQLCCFLFFAWFRSWKKARFKSISRFLVLCIFCLWSRWSFIHSYLDSGSSIASSTKFLPVKRHFSSQVTKKTFNMTLICFIFLLLMHRFFKNSCSYLC